MKLTLFNKCLGLNDARAFGTQIMKTNPRDPEAGQAELIACNNLTFTDDGCLETVPDLVTVITHSAPVTGLSAEERFFYADATDTNEWVAKTSFVKRFPLLTGAICHTPIDVRLSTGAAVYKSLAGTAMTVATVGTDNRPDKTKPVYAMPAYNQAFAYNGFLYGINSDDPRFLQHSSAYGFDLWQLGDDFIPHATAVMQAGAIPGVMVTTHANGVTVYDGMNKSNFVKRFYPCLPINKTLFSGLVSKAIGYLHVMLCADGVYAVLPDASFVRLTENIDNAAAFNTAYVGATAVDRKYLAVGDTSIVEFDFKNKGLLKRSSNGASGVCRYEGAVYLAHDEFISKLDSAIGTSTASLTLPYSDFSAPGKKSLEALYFTGTIEGCLLITATDQTGLSWEIEVDDELTNVSNYRIKTPKGMLGNHISFKFETTGGQFRLEELTAMFAASKRRH